MIAVFVSSLLINVDEKVWIGLTDEHSYKQYYWNDGSDLTYTNWNAKEPNGYSVSHLNVIYILLKVRSRRCHVCMVVGFTTTCAISAYHH